MYEYLFCLIIIQFISNKLQKKKKQERILC